MDRAAGCVGRYIGFAEFSGGVGLIDVSFHLNQIGDTFECFFFSQRNLNGNTHAAEVLLNRFQRPFKAGRIAIHAINHDESRQLKLVGVTPGFFGLDHDARNGIDDDDRSIRNPQRPAGFLDEVSEAGRIEHVDLVFIPLAEGELGRDSDLSLDFFFVVIGRGIPIVYAPKAIGRTRIVENRRNQRGLAASSVPHDANIANVLAFVDVNSHSLLLLKKPIYLRISRSREQNSILRGNQNEQRR